jgi:hypothetical protein
MKKAQVGSFPALYAILRDYIGLKVFQEQTWLELGTLSERVIFRLKRYFVVIGFCLILLFQSIFLA